MHKVILVFPNFHKKVFLQYKYITGIIYLLYTLEILYQITFIVWWKLQDWWHFLLSLMSSGSKLIRSLVLMLQHSKFIYWPAIISVVLFLVKIAKNWAEKIDQQSLIIYKNMSFSLLIKKDLAKKVNLMKEPIRSIL